MHALAIVGVVSIPVCAVGYLVILIRQYINPDTKPPEDKEGGWG